jgi:putative ABC transport system ATP-binding protein
MQLQIKNLLPTYLDESRKMSSEVWGMNLSFNKGELVKIIAPSGSGKTSLIHFLYGMRNEYNGSISYDSKELKSFSIEEMAAFRKNHLSVVFQDLRLFPTQTVLQNLEIKRQLNPYHSAEKIKEMAEHLGIGDKLQSPGGRCSYGEQQRVSIIRALLQPFDFLLLDEPFSHLDSANAKKSMDLILEEAKQRNACVLFCDLERIDLFPFTKLLHL